MKTTSQFTLKTTTAVIKPVHVLKKETQLLVRQSWPHWIRALCQSQVLLLYEPVQFNLLWKPNIYTYTLGSASLISHQLERSFCSYLFHLCYYSTSALWSSVALIFYHFRSNKLVFRNGILLGKKKKYVKKKGSK